MLLTVAIIILVLLVSVGIYVLLHLNYAVEDILMAAAAYILLIAAIFLARRGLSSFVEHGIFNKRSAVSFKY